MNVEFLCLSILCEGEASGYDINRRFSRGEEALFAGASISAVYPALRRLKEKSFVTIRTEAQAGRPNRKIYSLTDAGREAFRLMIELPVEDDHFSSPFLYLMRFAHLLPCDAVHKRIVARQERLDADLVQMEAMMREYEGDSRRLWLLRQRHAMTRALLESLKAATLEFCETRQHTSPGTR